MGRFGSLSDYRQYVDTDPEPEPTKDEDKSNSALIYEYEQARQEERRFRQLADQRQARAHVLQRLLRSRGWIKKK